MIWEKLTSDNEEELYEAVENNDAVILARYLDGKFQYLTQDSIVDTIHTHAKREDTYYIILDKPIIKTKLVLLVNGTEDLI